MLSNEQQNNLNISNSSSNIGEHKYNLYQQFFIIGIEPKLMFNINKVELKSVPEPYLSPKIISKFPQKELYYLNIPDNIVAMHCFPHGILNEIIDYNELNYELKIKCQKSFVFSLENQYPEERSCSLRTKRVYYSCLLFYENVENYHECLINRKNLFKSKLKDIDLFSEPKNKGLLIPKIICLSSFRPFFEQSITILESLKKYVDNFLFNRITKGNFNIYPIEKIIEGLIYNLPALPRSNFILKLNRETFEPSYNNKIENNSSINNSKNENIFKIDRYSSSSSLRTINLSYNNDNNNINLNNEIIFYESSFNQPPKNIINYSILMRYFRIKEVFEIIKFIILEEPILFFCEDIHLLTCIIEGLISLIYPFEYQYPIISILPEQNYSFISIFNHFIFGINHKFTDDIFQKKGISLDEKKYIIIIKIEKRFENIINTNDEDKLKYSVISSILSDNNRAFLKIESNKMDNFENKEDINNENEDKQEEKRNITLPMHYFEKCSKLLEKNTVDKYNNASSWIKNKKGLTLEEKENIFNNEIRNTFIYFFSCILLRYQSFCIKYDKKIEVIGMNDSNTNKSNELLNSTLITNVNYNSNLDDKDFDFFYERENILEEKYLLNKLEINDIFNCKNFIEDNDTPKLDRPFYKKLFETKIFFNFIKKKIFPNSIQDKLDILYFDNKVNEKLSRGTRKIKVETKFLYEDLKKLSSTIKINTLKKLPNQKIIEFFENTTNCNKAINYFQNINNGNIKINNNKINRDSNWDNETMDTGNCIVSLQKVFEDIEGDNSSNFMFTRKTIKSIKDFEDDEIIEENKNKVTFSYYVFPKLLNDNLLLKEDIFLEETNNENNLINNCNIYNLNNCNSLYNQFENEANIFLNKPIIQNNYKMYDYSLTAKWNYKYKFDECVNKLWLLYLAKTFYSITFSKKRYYFEEIIMFLNDKNNMVEQDTILLLFNAINKYGDRSMNQELFMFLQNKNYINFLSLREKTKSQNNFIKYITNNNNNNNLESKRNSNVGEIYRTGTLESARSSDIINKIKINKKLFNFIIYSYCIKNINEKNNINTDVRDDILININKDNNDGNLNINENNLCGEQLSFTIKDLFSNENNKKYIEIKCPKCQKIQNITITCFYSDENNNNYQINFNLLSPLALLKEPWFKNYNTLDTLIISQEHPEEYLSAIFYFYEQGLPCNFLIPKGLSEQELKEEKTEKYNNLDTFDYDLISEAYRNKKKFISFYSPNITKRDLNYKERINNFDFKKVVKQSPGKSPSPKKSCFNKKKNIAQKLKNNEYNKKKIVTFSCFKK